MSFAITYTIGGVIYNLNGYDSAIENDIYYLGDQGFGMAPLHRITQRGPLQQGDTDLDFRLDPRIIQIPLFINSTTIDSLYATRARLLSIFTPSNQLGVLTITTDYFTRAINCKVLGGLAFDTDVKNGYSLRSIVQLRAEDPTWYNPTANIINLSSAIAGTPTPIPRIYPVTYGASALNGSVTFAYNGNWQTYPVITATGPITNFIITNTSTGEFIQIPGVIPAGRFWTINLLYGYKTVFDDLGVNKISAVSSSSNLATFSIDPAPSVSGGSNTITVTGTTTSSTSAVSMTYFDRYIGI